MNKPKERLSDLVYSQLFSMIANGELDTGEPLQERRVAGMLGVSRTPVRDAFKRLVAEGLIDGDGRLPTVRQLDASVALEILAIRLMFEPNSAALAAKHPDVKIIKHLIAEIESIMAMESPTAEHHWNLDDSIHHSIATMSGFKLLPGILSELRTKNRIYNKNAIPERFLPGCQEHLSILNAILQGDHKAARDAMTLHLGNTKSSILNRFIYTPD